MLLEAKLFAGNLTSCFNMSRLTIESMRERGFGLPMTEALILLLFSGFLYAVNPASGYDPVGAVVA